MDPSTFSSEHINNKMITLTSEIFSSEDCFETKLQTNFDKSDQNSEHPEEKLMNSIEQPYQQSEHIE